MGPVTAGLLGEVQGRVGGGQQVGDLAADGVQRGDADRDSQPDARGTVGDGDGQRGDPGPQPLGDAQRVRLARLGQQDDELLPAEPPHHVVLAQLVEQHVADRSQHRVPDQVTVSVIDRLEVIDVDQGHGQRTAGPDGPGDLRRGLALPGRRVEEPRLGVDAGLGEKLGVHHEPPGQQHGGHGEKGQDGIEGHDHRDQDGEIELGEVGLQRLAVHVQVE